MNTSRILKVRTFPKALPNMLARDVRVTLVGDGVNEPEPFPGYAGFVGWSAPVRLSRTGELLVAFNAGYWHCSPPTPWRYTHDEAARLLALGLPDNVEAPQGGRCMLIRSKDNGRTWSRPETFINTHQDDRHPAPIELDNGVLLCSFFTFTGAPPERVAEQRELGEHVAFVRSFDGGATWEDTPIRPPLTFQFDASDGPPVQLHDGSIVLATYGTTLPENPPRIWSHAIWRSLDRGASWRLEGTINTPYDFNESHLAQLHDGRLVLIARPHGFVCWSDDLGRTWTEPIPTGINTVDPNLLVLRDGALVCVHGNHSPGCGGLRVIMSHDGGETWSSQTPTCGFAIDATYGYSRSIELPDGSIFCTYTETGAYTREDARRNRIFAVRFRIRENLAGIDLLPPEF